MVYPIRHGPHRPRTREIPGARGPISVVTLFVAVPGRVGRGRPARYQLLVVKAFRIASAACWRIGSTRREIAGVKALL